MGPCYYTTFIVDCLIGNLTELLFNLVECVMFNKQEWYVEVHYESTVYQIFLKVKTPTIT